MHPYWVWFDTLLEEYFWLEDSPQAVDFLSKLAHEGIHAKEVLAPDPSSALEAAFPDRKNRPRSTPSVH